jgi:hypothetical protein
MFSAMKRPHDVKLSRQEGGALIERLEADALSARLAPDITGKPMSARGLENAFEKSILCLIQISAFYKFGRWNFHL